MSIELTWVGVKGHAGDPGHEHAVALARRGIEEAATMVRSAPMISAAGA